MSDRGRRVAMIPRALAAILVAAAATVTALQLYFGPFQAPSAAVRDLYAGTPSDNPYEILPRVAKPAPPAVVLSSRLNRTAPVERYLIASGLSRVEAREWAWRFRRVAGTSLLRRHHWFLVYKDPDSGSVRGIRYDLSPHTAILERTLGAGLIETHRERIDYSAKPVKVAFAIQGSFYQSARHHDVPMAIIHSLERAFSGHDHLRRLPAGSAVKLIYTERVSQYGNHRIPGRIKAVEIEGLGKPILAFAFKDRRGNIHLYNQYGDPIGPEFLKFPLHFDFISSRFSYHRWQPILHIYRPHLGVDLAAPIGTPVRSIANGVVIWAGWYGGLGKCVRIRHEGDIISLYGHLSRLSPAARVGNHVRMGQVIGYVGVTGLSTGPHLHFGIEKQGRFVNPLTQHLGVHHKVSPRMKSLFEKVEARYRATLAGLPDLAHRWEASMDFAQTNSARDKAGALAPNAHDPQARILRTDSKRAEM